MWGDFTEVIFICGYAGRFFFLWLCIKSLFIIYAFDLEKYLELSNGELNPRIV